MDKFWKWMYDKSMIFKKDNQYYLYGVAIKLETIKNKYQQLLIGYMFEYLFDNGLNIDKITKDWCINVIVKDTNNDLSMYYKLKQKIEEIQ